MINSIEEIGVSLDLEFNEEETNFINKAIRRILVKEYCYLCEEDNLDVLDDFKWSMKVEFERTVRECVDMTMSNPILAKELNQ